MVSKLWEKKRGFAQYVLLYIFPPGFTIYSDPWPHPAIMKSKVLVCVSIIVLSNLVLSENCS